ncbi:hypothetical protein K432DRAFT_398775 [Lepidopterella palustris CBS 459.81]|uniref:DUF7881 domain-containing protein n=1 Tax=Lepidopterella palustris CBS 459.81 TaxID=1314670 RepID=A0A8E2DXR6_9PEZI|nr:hypothetical protein K432DRAFT_398775 [Lepidopterella palustris CBS 459.81]
MDDIRVSRASRQNFLIRNPLTRDKRPRRQYQRYKHCASRFNSRQQRQNANFYSMVEILVILTGTFFLRDEGDTKIKRDDHPLQSGKCYIIATDCRHVISVEEVVSADIANWTGVEAAHTFTLAHEGY